jgi:hypothetical protein
MSGVGFTIVTRYIAKSLNREGSGTNALQFPEVAKSVPPKQNAAGIAPAAFAVQYLLIGSDQSKTTT